MADWIIGCLLFAWLLSWFDFDKIFANACNELFKWNVSTSTYYFIFFLSGVILGIIDMIRTGKI
jgi:hypothetical protein